MLTSETNSLLERLGKIMEYDRAAELGMESAAAFASKKLEEERVHGYWRPTKEQRDTISRHAKKRWAERKILARGKKE